MTGHYNTFLVKIWTDKRAARGHVQHVQSKEYVYFGNLEKMVHFIVSRLNASEDNSEIMNGNKIQDSQQLLSKTHGHNSSDKAMFPE